MANFPRPRHESSLVTRIHETSSRRLPSGPSEGNALRHLQIEPEIQGAPGPHQRHPALEEGREIGRRISAAGEKFSVCFHGKRAARSRAARSFSPVEMDVRRFWVAHSLKGGQTLILLAVILGLQWVRRGAWCGPRGGVAESVDARDSKSRSLRECGFESHRRYFIPVRGGIDYSARPFGGPRISVSTTAVRRWAGEERRRRTEVAGALVRRFCLDWL